MLTNNQADDINDVHEVMQQAQMNHSEMFLVSRTNHVVMSDGKWFVKLSAQDGAKDNLLQELLAMQNPSLFPGSAQVRLLRTSNGRSALISPKIGLAVNPFEASHEGLKQSLQAVAQTPVDSLGFTPADPSEWVQEHKEAIRRRLDSIEDPGLAKSVDSLCERLVRNVGVLLDAPVVLSHGDAGVQNAVQDAHGRIHWVDWENVRLAPDCWDSFSLYMTFYLRGIFFDHKQVQDDEVFQACASLKIAESASWAAYKKGKQDIELRASLAKYLGLLQD